MSDGKTVSKNAPNPHAVWFERIVGVSEEDFQKTIAMNEVFC
jgi:hypothetical protein